MEMGSIYLLCVVRGGRCSHFNTKLESPFNFTNIHLLPVYRKMQLASARRDDTHIFRITNQWSAIGREHDHE
jgi:hypothetical protein